MTERPVWRPSAASLLVALAFWAVVGGLLWWLI